jgi:hypothetical protein
MLCKKQCDVFVQWKVSIGTTRRDWMRRCWSEEQSDEQERSEGRLKISATTPASVREGPRSIGHRHRAQSGLTHCRNSRANAHFRGAPTRNRKAPCPCAAN